MESWEEKEFGRVEAECAPVGQDTRQLARGTLGHLPCTVGHTGAARTEEFFLVRPHTTHSAAKEGSSEAGESAEQEQMLESSFRGRLLLGSAAVLPEDYEVVLYAEADGDMGVSGAQQHYVPFAQASDVVVWNQELPPCDTDPLRRALCDWPVIAQAVCLSFTSLLFGVIVFMDKELATDEQVTKENGVGKVEKSSTHIHAHEMEETRFPFVSHLSHCKHAPTNFPDFQD